MSRKLLTLSLTATLMGGTAYADTPQVAVDIAPVHSLVARVMDGVGMPDLIIQPGASPHEYSLRPSEAAALQNSDLVFWIGPDLTPWLTDTIETLAKDASVTSLLDLDGTVQLDFRESALFEVHDHDDHDGTAAHDKHDHGDHDPHAWLSPKNAMTWLNVIAGQLSSADPDNAGTYFANAAAGRTEIELLIGEVTATLDRVRGTRFIVFHDAYQYFEMDFNFQASGAISLSDASDPSPARITEIRDRVMRQGIDCVLAEPQFNPKLIATVLDGTDAKTGIVDPLGSDLEPGSSLYPELIRNLSTALASCM